MKKGISLVALVITIIVLIILTAAVVYTSGNAPESANLAVFFSDLGNVQDAVTLKIMSNSIDASLPGATVTKLSGIADETTTAVANDGTKNYYAFTATATDLGLSGADLSKYVVAEDGTVAYWNAGVGFVYNSTTYYARTTGFSLATGAHS